MSTKDIKKIFPILSFTALLAIGAVVQLTFFNNDLKATGQSLSEEKTKFYEEVYKTLELTTSNGKKYVLKNIKNKVVLLNFWASWCRPCITEFKSLNELISIIPEDKLLVLGINNDDENAKVEVEKVEKKYKLAFESVIDTDSSVAAKFKINNIPATVVYFNGKFLFFNNRPVDFTGKDFLKLVNSKMK